jgi:hypothetical protein
MNGMFAAFCTGISGSDNEKYQLLNYSGLLASEVLVLGVSSSVEPVLSTRSVARAKAMRESTSPAVPG